jgi:hypothetical protein
MSDSELLRLRRELRANPSPANHAALYTCGLRRGLLALEDVQLAAYCTAPGAALAASWDSEIPTDPVKWVEGLTEWKRSLTLVGLDACYAAAKFVEPLWPIENDQAGALVLLETCLAAVANRRDPMPSKAEVSAAVGLAAEFRRSLRGQDQVTLAEDLPNRLRHFAVDSLLEAGRFHWSRSWDHAVSSVGCASISLFGQPRAGPLLRAMQEGVLAHFDLDSPVPFEPRPRPAGPSPEGTLPVQ